jgi:UPF0489 domain
LTQPSTSCIAHGARERSADTISIRLEMQNGDYGMNVKPPDDWIVPFKGRNTSGFFEQNFLWKSGDVYVMDNHRAALWCWLQHIAPEKKHSIFHIDRHYDTLKCDRWVPHLPTNWKMSIEEYLEYPFVDDDEYEDRFLDSTIICRSIWINLVDQ